MINYIKSTRDGCIYAYCRDTGRCLYPDRSRDLNCPKSNVLYEQSLISLDRERLIDSVRD